MDFYDLNPYLVRDDGDISNPSPSFNEQTEVKITKEPEAVRAPIPIPPLTPQPMIEQAYIEDILHLNVGKSGTFYFSYGSSKEWIDRSYKGVIEQVGRDHFIIRDPKTDKRHLVQLGYLNWAEFDDAIKYPDKG